MKKIILADFACYVDKTGKPYGHFIHFFQDWDNLLSKRYNVKIVCSKDYSNHLAIYGSFNHFKSEKQINVIPFFSRVFTFLRIIRNGCFSLKKIAGDYDILILQPSHFLANCIIVLLSKNIINNSISLILYKDHVSNNKFRSFILSSLKGKLFGIVTTLPELEKVYKSYHSNCINLPDYIERQLPIDYEDSYQIKLYNSNIKYDVALIGIIGDNKDVESFVTFVGENGFSAIIAGNFLDKKRYKDIKQLIKHKKYNIKIKDAYLSDQEYKMVFISSKFIVMPYLYAEKLQSSGVVYDALYALRPIIASYAPFSRFLGENELGFLYRKSLSELNNFYLDENIYIKMQQRIGNYLLTLKRNNWKKIYHYIG